MGSPSSRNSSFRKPRYIRTSFIAASFNEGTLHVQAAPEKIAAAVLRGVLRTLNREKAASSCDVAMQHATALYDFHTR